LSIHNRKSIRSLKEYDENSFHSVIEVLLNPKLYISEIRLVVEYKKSRHKYGFADIFICDNVSGDGALIELKLLNLRGLYNGKLGRWNKDPDYKELEKLDEELRSESEEDLLERKYMFWDKDKDNSKLIDVESYIKGGESQLNKYFNALENGEARITENRVGILDPRIKVEHGLSFLRGFLIASFGSQRILIRKLNPKMMNYKFFINN
jgi:hypothetical protein